MATTVPQLFASIDELEMARARAWQHWRDADRALLDVNDQLRNALVLAARDPAKTAAVARLSTTAELAAAIGDTDGLLS